MVLLPIVAAATRPVL